MRVANLKARRAKVGIQGYFGQTEKPDRDAGWRREGKERDGVKKQTKP
jgi:hypothetical protein